MKVSSPPCDQRCITESNVKSDFRKMCSESRFNCVVSDIDLRSFDKLFHETGPAYEKARSQILW